MKKTSISRIVALILCLTAFLSFVNAQVKPIKDLNPTVILISIDGLRYDYLDKYSPGNLKNLLADALGIPRIPEHLPA